MLFMLIFSLLSPNILFCAELPIVHELPAAPIDEEIRCKSLQEQCMDVVLSHRIDSKMLPLTLQAKIAPKERAYLENILEKAQNHENVRKRLLERLEDRDAYQIVGNDFHDDPEHISYVFPRLYEHYLNMRPTDSNVKKCLACLATESITPGHCMLCLNDICFYTAGCAVMLTPVLVPTAVTCCQPQCAAILKTLFSIIATSGICFEVGEQARNHCNGYTRQCYDYLTESDENFIPIIQPIISTTSLYPDQVLDK